MKLSTLWAVATVVSTTLFGCIGSIQEAESTSDRIHAVVDGAQPLVHDVCTAPAQQWEEEFRALEAKDPKASEAFAREKLNELDKRRCRKVWTAYDTARAASIMLDAVIAAVQSGQCVGVSKAVDRCNTAGAMVDALKAGVELATIAKDLKR